MKSKVAVFIMMIFCNTSVFAQPSFKRVRGIVEDSVSRKVLENATLSLYQLPANILRARTRSSRSGFEFRLADGNYSIITTFIGYKDDTLTFNISVRDSLIRLRPIQLVRSDSNMLEVVVRTVIPPATVRNDTISYNANSFKTRPNATVEELLKKLPGVEVDKDGNVTVQGQKVEKIKVDGKEFFLNDPKMATQNLLANMIEKIDVFDNKSDFSQATGIPDNSEGKVINLRLKPDKKTGLFGKAWAADGNEGRYSTGLNANYFKKDNHFFIQAGSNNTGGLFNPNTLSNGSRIPPGTNRNTQFAANYSGSISKKIDINSSVNIGGAKTNNSNLYHRQTLLGDSSLLLDQSSTATGILHNQRVYLNVNYKISKLSNLKFDGALSASQNKVSTGNNQSTQVLKVSSYLLNDGFTNNYNQSNNSNGNYSLLYSQRFRKAGRYLQVNFNNGFNQSESKGQLLSVTHFQNDTLTRNQHSRQDNHGNNYNMGISYAEPVGRGQLLDLSYSLTHNYNSATSNTNNYDSLTGLYDDPDTLATNSFRNKFTQQQWSLGYSYLKTKVHYGFGMSVQKTAQDNTDLSGHYGDIHQSFINIYPRASFSYSISRRENLRVNYQGSTINPDVTQLQPLPDYSNPLLLKLGNPNLRPSFNQNIFIGLNNFNSKKFRSFLVQAGFASTSNRIVNSTLIDSAGIQEQQWVNINGNYSLNGNISYGFPLGNSKNGNGTVSSGFQYGHDNSLLNGQLNTKVSLAWTPRVRINFNVKDRFYAELSTGINSGKANYTLQGAISTSFLNQEYSADLSYVFPFDLTLSTTFHSEITSSQGNLPGRTVNVWNASAGKKIFAKKSGEIRFSAYDLLNSNSSFTQGIGDNYIETNKANVLTRLFLVSFIYDFNRSL